MKQQIEQLNKSALHPRPKRRGFTAHRIKFQIGNSNQLYKAFTNAKWHVTDCDFKTGHEQLLFKTIFNIKYIENPASLSWKDDYLEFESEEHYFAWLLQWS